jgi:hypothetical protein
MNFIYLRYAFQLTICAMGAIWGTIQFHSSMSAFGVTFGAYSFYLILFFSWRTNIRYIALSLLEVLCYAVILGFFGVILWRLFHHPEMVWVTASLAFINFYEDPKGAYRP